MATIVKNNYTGKRYFLLGAGFGTYKSVKPDIFGDVKRDMDEGESALVCVCNSKGEIFWFETTQITVISIDGENIQELDTK